MDRLVHFTQLSPPVEICKLCKVLLNFKTFCRNNVHQIYPNYHHYSNFERILSKKVSHQFSCNFLQQQSTWLFRINTKNFERKSIQNLTRAIIEICRISCNRWMFQSCWHFRELRNKWTKDNFVRLCWKSTAACGIRQKQIFRHRNPNCTNNLKKSLLIEKLYKKSTANGTTKIVGTSVAQRTWAARNGLIVVIDGGTDITTAFGCKIHWNVK